MAVEIAQVIKEKGRMFDWADKVDNHKEMTKEDKDISQAVDMWAKDMGTYGDSADHKKDFANFITKIVEPEVYNPDSMILQKLFTEQDIGEFDEISLMEAPKNTLQAHEVAKGTNADKSYIDFSRGKVFRKFLQVETEIKYSDLRKGGYKSIATLSNYAVEALNNEKFASVFNAIDSLITVPSNQGFSASGGLTMGVMDEAAGYVLDRGTDPILLGLSTDMRGVNRMTGYDAFYSENMKNALNMNSILATYLGVPLATVNASKKDGFGNTLLPQKKIFGIAEQIGGFSMIGGLRTYVTPDNNNEKYTLKFTGYEFTFNIIKPEKICKILIA